MRVRVHVRAWRGGTNGIMSPPPIHNGRRSSVRLCVLRASWGRSATPLGVVAVSVRSTVCSSDALACTRVAIHQHYKRGYAPGCKRGYTSCVLTRFKRGCKKGRERGHKKRFATARRVSTPRDTASATAWCTHADDGTTVCWTRANGVLSLCGLHTNPRADRVLTAC